MIQMILALVVLVFLGFGDTAKAYLLVEDIPNLSTNVVNEVKNYAQYSLRLPTRLPRSPIR